ncbi:killer cell lectin-like receptor subfamily B member 1B allele A [Pogona vitticeps]
MANEIIYADLGFSSEPSSARALRPSQEANASRDSHCLRTALWIGWSVNIVLVILVIVLLVFQMRECNPADGPEKDQDCQRSSNGREDNSCPETVTKLRTFLCKPLDNSTTECRICPENWLRHKSKCYWISKEKQSWHKGQDDCREKHAQMWVIRSQEEQRFIWKMISEERKLPWIGLKTTSAGDNWSWIDGSPLNDTTSQSLGIAEPNSCGMLKNNQISSQSCGSIAQWICETEAFLV